MRTLAAAVETFSFADRLVTFLAIGVAVVLGLLLSGEPRCDGVGRGRIAVAVAVPLVVIGAAVLLPDGTLGLLWF